MNTLNFTEERGEESQVQKVDVNLIKNCKNSHKKMKKIRGNSIWITFILILLIFYLYLVLFDQCYELPESLVNTM